MSRVTRSNLYLLFLIGFGIVLSQCAQPMAPTGGPRDEQPPRLDTVESTPNFQTNFTLQDIDLYFDEFVQVSNVFQQVLVSPPLDNLPKVSARLKRIRFEFPEETILKENATYTINFGSSIKDFTEGNVLKDYRFVFSTGDFIDSLELSGQVVDAYDGSPETDVVVMLYDSFKDSIVYKEKPFYFASTDDNGLFRFQNLRSDTFKIFALKDANLNYLFDSEAEEIGFLTREIIVHDTIFEDIRMELFLPDQELQILNSETRDYGKVWFLFSETPEYVNYQFLDTPISHFHRLEKDSLLIYYESGDLSNLSLILNEGDQLIDTINWAISGKSEFLQSAVLIPSRSNLSKTNVVPQNGSLDIVFNHPLASFSDSLMSLKDTSQLNRPITSSIDSLDKRIFKLNSNWNAGEEFTLELLPGCIKDIYQISHDTISIKVKIAEEVLYGKMEITIDSLNPERVYIVELIKDKKVLLKEQIRQDSSQILTFENQKPGNYSVRILEDLNDNGRWDPGNYQMKIQSEKVQSESVGDLRENWEMNKSISWKKKN